MEQEKFLEPIVGVNGNMITVEYSGRIMQNEVAYAAVGDARIKCEVIRVRGKYADLQVFESTNGLKVGDMVEFTGELLSVELGPGLLTQVYDGEVRLFPSARHLSARARPGTCLALYPAGQSRG